MTTAGPRLIHAAALAACIGILSSLAAAQTSGGSFGRSNWGSSTRASEPSRSPSYAPSPRAERQPDREPARSPWSTPSRTSESHGDPFGGTTSSSSRHEDPSSSSASTYSEPDPLFWPGVLWKLLCIATALATLALHTWFVDRWNRTVPPSMSELQVGMRVWAPLAGIKQGVLRSFRPLGHVEVDLRDKHTAGTTIELGADELLPSIARSSRWWRWIDAVLRPTTYIASGALTLSTCVTPAWRVATVPVAVLLYGLLIGVCALAVIHIGLRIGRTTLARVLDPYRNRPVPLETLGEARPLALRPLQSAAPSRSVTDARAPAPRPKQTARSAQPFKVEFLSLALFRKDAAATVQTDLDAALTSIPPDAPLGAITDLLRTKLRAWSDSACMIAHGSTAFAAPEQARECLEQWLQRERSRFAIETVRADSGTVRRVAAPSSIARREEGLGIVVVTVLMVWNAPDPDSSFSLDTGATEPRTVATTAADAVLARDGELVAIEVVWFPSGNDDVMSSAELAIVYPEMRAIDPRARLGRMVCTHCAAVYAGELGQCPACGAALPESLRSSAGS